MSKNRLIKLIPLKNGRATHLKIQVYYSLGGMNYFQGCSEPRGIYLSVTPVSRTNHEGGMVSESVTAFSGTKEHLVDMPRFNQKKLDNFIIPEKNLTTLLNHVINKNSLELDADLLTEIKNILA